MMTSEKKCPDCGQWTTWNHQLNDTCQHCGELLDKRRIQDLNSFENQQKTNDENSFFAIKPGDNSFMIFIRKTGWVINVIYVSIVSFMLWLLAWLAG